MGKRRILEAIVLSCVLGVGTVSTRAASLTLFDTGVDDSGRTLPDGATDPHYTIRSFPGGGGQAGLAFAAVVGIPGSYIQADPVGVPGSQWISGPTIHQGSQQVGDFLYQLSFPVPANFDPSSGSATASITGRIASDNSVTVTLNGITVQDITNPVNYTSYTDLAGLTVPSDFHPGQVNALQFVVHNTPGPLPNPQGLRIDGISGEVSSPGIGVPGPAVPEPASLISSLTGMIVVAGMMAQRRWRAVKA